MEALVCKMCQGNKLVKEGDFFVCQNCGTRYTNSEAQSMYVKVVGGVTIDRSEEEIKYCKLADNYLSERDFVSAKRYYEKVLEINPDNWQVHLKLKGCKALRDGDVDGFRVKLIFNIIKNQAKENGSIKENIEFVRGAVECTIDILLVSWIKCLKKFKPLKKQSRKDGSILLDLNFSNRL